MTTKRRASKPATTAPVATDCAPKSLRGTRSRGPGKAGAPVAIYEAASQHPLIPRVYDPAPSVTARQQRHLQTLARHLYRNDPFIRNLVNVAGRLYIGSGPVPVSRYPELDELWAACSRDFDNTGRRSFGGWLRQDVYRNVRIDGECFVRRRVRDDDSPEAEVLNVPIEFEAHTSEFCPHDHNVVENGLRYVAGIASVRSKPVSYVFYGEHPGEANTRQVKFSLPRREIYHVCDPLTGSPRGEVMIASALLRAIKLSTLEDSELRRKHVASLMSIFIERPIDGDEEVVLPDEDEIGEMLDAVEMAPGAVNQLPPGYKMNSFTPPDEPASFEKALRWQLMAICASVGLPVNEITGDDNGVERYGRFLTERVKSQATLERDMLEHQLLNPMRRDFIDAAQAWGLWTPPPEAAPWEIYECTWQWPVIPSARLDQELNSLMSAVEKGHLPHSHVSRVLFGLAPETVARSAAGDAARQQAVGLQATKAIWAPDTDVAVRIQGAAIAVETAERDLVDESFLEDSVLN